MQTQHDVMASQREAAHMQRVEELMRAQLYAQCQATVRQHFGLSDRQYEEQADQLYAQALAKASPAVRRS